MFSSRNNGNDPISYSYQQAYNGNFFNDIISTSKQEDLPSSFLRLPSPFQDEFEIADYDVFIQHNRDLLLPQQPLQFNNPTISETMDSMVDSNKNDVSGSTKICTKKSHHSAQQITIRKRSSKRDRHSKIDTRQGPRDRRMRLSLKVAREFFDLQDMLGLDKPSKTVEWLLVQARDEIKKLFSSGQPQMNYSCSVGTKSASPTSECEVVSGIDEAAIKESISILKGKISPCVNKEKKTKPSRKTGFHILPRESRNKARERARKRTKEKMLSQRTNESKLCEEASNHELSQLGCCCLSPFETGEESGIQSLTMNHPSMDMLVEIEPPSSHGEDPFGTAEDIINDSSLMTTKWSPPSFIFNYLYNNGIPQENHFTELEHFNKLPWEPYNIQSLCQN